MSRRLDISSLLCDVDAAPQEPSAIVPDHPVIRSPVSHMRRSLSPYTERRPRVPGSEPDPRPSAMPPDEDDEDDTTARHTFFRPVDIDGEGDGEEDGPPSSAASASSDERAVRMPRRPLPAPGPSEYAAGSTEWDPRRDRYDGRRYEAQASPLMRSPPGVGGAHTAAARSPVTSAFPLPLLHRSPGASVPAPSASPSTSFVASVSPQPPPVALASHPDAYTQRFSPPAYVGPPARMLSGPGIPPPSVLHKRNQSSPAATSMIGPSSPAEVYSSPPRSSAYPTVSPPRSSSQHVATSPRSASGFSGLDVLMHAATVHEARERQRRNSVADVRSPVVQPASPMAYTSPVPEDNADDWLLEQVSEQPAQRAYSPPLSDLPPTSALQGPGLAPPQAWAASTSAASRAPKTKASKSKKKGKADSAGMMDVDDELLSLVGEALPAKRVLMGPGVEVDMGDRASMPPPPDPQFDSLDAASKKKPVPKTKQPAKPRAKAPAKSKAKAPAPAATPTAVDLIPVTSSGRTKKAPARFADAAGSANAVASTSRSRSTSVMPPVTAVAEAAKVDAMELEEEMEEDDRLYCLCQRRWDENSVMIGCDICEGWYHPKCVKMPEHWIDLVDQYVCPNCTGESKRTTWKQRCKYGLSAPDPSSPSTCHKPVRAEGSKYCSDECGVRHMKSRIDTWATHGGRRDQLWESVKLVARPEGLVSLPPDAPAPRAFPPPTTTTHGEPPPVAYDPDAPLPVVSPPESRVAREVGRLQAQVDEWRRRRAELVQGAMRRVVWREDLLRLASRRAEGVDECGWDQRLCYADYDVETRGEEALGSYAQVDGEGMEEGQWWCRWKRKCERHAGWQKLRSQDLTMERQLILDAIKKFEDREQDNNRRIRAMLTPQTQPAPYVNGDAGSSARTTALPAVNGNGNTSKRGKKRKAD